MPLPLFILCIALCILAVPATGYWIVVLIESIRTARALPTAAQALGFPEAKLIAASPASQPRILVVIPAHNEQAVIARVTASLCALHYTNFHAVFALDRCTDQTRARLQAAAKRPDGSPDTRIGFVEIDTCPPDWAGKVNAIHQAVQRTISAEPAGESTFDYILFADADTTFHPDCLIAAMSLLKHSKLDMLSLMSTLSVSTWFELCVQPAAGFQLLVQYPPRRANRAANRRPIGNGQFMLFSRACYSAIDGHTHVKDHLLEDIALARLVHLRGMNPGFLPAAGMFYCEMYRDWAQFQRGWKRIFAELSSRSPSRLRKYASRLFIFSALLPSLAVVAILAGVSIALATGDILGWITAGFGATAIAALLAAMFTGGGWSKMPAAAAFLHPIGAFLTVRIMFAAAAEIQRGEPVLWGGRSYDLSKPLGPLPGYIDGRPPTPAGPPATASAAVQYEPVSTV